MLPLFWSQAATNMSCSGGGGGSSGGGGGGGWGGQSLTLRHSLDQDCMGERRGGGRSWTRFC